MPNPIKTSTPQEVLEAVPALLGYYPTESVVALLFEQTPDGLALEATARMDVPTNDTDNGLMHDTIRQVMDRSARAILVIYTADQDEARDLMRGILTRIDPGKVQGALLATMLGWTTVDPERPGVIEWTNPYPTATGTVAAELAAEGHYPIGTRYDLADSIEAPDAETAQDYALGRALDPLPSQPTDEQMDAMAEEVQHWIAEYLRQPTTIIPEEAAYIAGRIRFGGPRDEVFRLLDKTNAEALTVLWQAVAGMTPDEDAVPVLACLALSAWVSRSGTLANLAIGRAKGLPDGPGAVLLAMVEELIARMVHPALWDRYKEEGM